MSDDDLKTLKDDPRFDKLIPKSAEFANRFSRKSGSFTKMESAHDGDQFGWIARRIGDVDRDGVNDLVTSAQPTPSMGRRPAVFMCTRVKGQASLDANGPPSGRLGIGIEAAGDVNADGVPDVIASAPGRARLMSIRKGR